MTADSFGRFCASVLKTKGWPGNISPDELAAAFVGHFGLPDFPRFADLDALVVREGIGTVVESSLPGTLRGAHFKGPDGHYVIHYSDDDWVGAREHTVLHEVYEILQAKFKSQASSYRPPRRPTICRNADRFAAEVLMQPDMFRLFAEQSGLDVAALQKMYGRSYDSVSLRLTEVMTFLPLIVSIYTRQATGQPEDWPSRIGVQDFSTSLVGVTRALKLGGAAPRRGAHVFPSSLAPKRGEVPRTGTAVAHVIEHSKPAYAERVPGYEDRDSDMVCLARPVFWRDHLARVVSVSVPRKLKSLIELQVASSSPDRVSVATHI